jgi:hypothetical protein
MKSNQDASPSAEEGFLPATKPMNKTRCLLLKLISIGSTLAGTKGFGQFICPGSDDMRLRNNARRVYDAGLVLYRPQDLLFLRMSFANFEIRKDKKLYRKSSGSAYVITGFQSQSIAETAYPESGSASVPAWLEQREHERMERQAHSAGAINVIANLIGGKPLRPLNGLETAIERPCRMFLSPGAMHKSVHDTHFHPY